jgi:Fe-Mn family superoxide dismutase
MKTNVFFTAVVAGIICLSCNEKKLTEVVEVPLPTKEEKAIIGHPDDVKADPGTFSIAKLGFEYDALEPHIDALTMEMHYARHYLTYTNNLNRAIEGTPLDILEIEDILKKSTTADMAVRNNAGGYYNHTLFWQLLTSKGGDKPTDSIATAIESEFGSFESFKTQFEDAASKQFGSGWAWLIVDRSGKLQITTTPNQDNPIMPGVAIPGKPILALDVWEHAYYLKYQYRRKNYINAFWNVVNWNKVNELYTSALATPKSQV